MQAEKITYTNSFEKVDTPTYKKMTIKTKILIMFLIFIAIGVFVLTFLKFDFKGFIESLKEILKKPNNYGIIFGLLLWVVIRPYYFIFLLQFRLKKLNVKVTKMEWLRLGVISLILVGLTPTSAGSEPYVTYFLRKKKLTVSMSTALSFSNGFLSQLSMFLMSLPIYIYSITYWGYISSIATASDVTSLVFLNAGMAIMVFVLIFYFGLCWSKHMHYFLSRIWNTSKKFLHLTYHTKLETIKTYLYESTLKKQFISFIKDIKVTLLLFFGILFLNFLMAFSMNISGIVMDKNNFISHISLAWLNILLASALAVGANGFLPMPGGEGTLQMIFMTIFKGFLKGYKIDSGELKSYSTDMLFLWRSSTFYIPLVSSILFFLINTSTRKIFKKINQKEKIEN